MDSKSKINIVSKRPRDFSSNITLGDMTYHVQTEDMGTKSCKIMTRIYLDGEILISRETDYFTISKLRDFTEKLGNLMENHHKATITAFYMDQMPNHKPKAEYLDEVQKLLKKGNGKSALHMLDEALKQYPQDLFLLSYYGYLTATVENKVKAGIKICEDTIKKLGQSMPYGTEFFYPVFYLNLGRAYLKGRKRKEAVEAFTQGLQNDPDNRELLWEMQKLGSRKKSPLPFLHRNNLLNKYLGIILSKFSKK